MPSLLQVWALPAIAIANISAVWFKLVSERVPEPYLVTMPTNRILSKSNNNCVSRMSFSTFLKLRSTARMTIRGILRSQPRQGCTCIVPYLPKVQFANLKSYLASLIIKPIAGCDTSTLRALNVGAICLICILSYQIRRTLRASQKPSSSNPDDKGQTSISDAHTALNISLFSPLFFFSGLYYTDVISTLVVLAAYSTYLSQRRSATPFLSSILTINIGVLALLFRQTNIFWVAIFPAGLSVIDTLKQHDEVFDTSVETAGPRHYFAFLLYLPRDVLLKRPVAIIKAVVPYVLLVGLFAAFVVWNGGVVLGDKSAHVATIHLPQMLYLWPYMVFFSVPLVLPSLLRPVVAILPAGLRNFAETYVTGKATRVGVPSLISAILFNAFGLAAVHFNTIVHPYTLADNRHYVFYVFRILLRYPWAKYAAVPVYYICAWLAVQTLGSATPPSTRSVTKKQVRTAKEDGSTQISWVVVWTAATALSVITAPLVEPRYFIIPWVMWRLHVPSLPTAGSKGGRQSYDLRLVLETVWLLAVNVGVGYMFLYRTFEWESEPGKVQRFLW